MHDHDHDEDDFNAIRGILIACTAGALAWIALIALTIS